MLRKTFSLFGLAMLALPQMASAEGVFSGFYGGAGLGYGFNGTAESTDPTAPLVNKFDLKGSQISLLGGYNVQLGHFIFGVEGDANFGKTQDKRTDAFQGVNYVGDASVKNYYSLRARVGFAPSENLLLYGTVGPAQGTLAAKVVLVSPLLGPLSPFTTADAEKSANGYVLGLGGELNLGKRSRLRLEYSEVYFNDVSFIQKSPFGFTGIVKIDSATSYVRSAVTFKF